MTQRRRRFRLTLVLAVLVALAWVALRALVSPPSVEIMLSELNTRLSEELGLTLVIGEAKIWPEQAQVILAPVSIQDADGVTVFSAARIEAELSPWKLFEKRVQLRSMSIEKPMLHVRISRDGRVLGIKVPEGLTPSGSDPLIKLDVFDFRLTEGRALVDMEGVGSIELEDISARLRETGEEGHRIKVSVGQGHVVRTHGKTEGKIDLDRFGAKLVVYGDGLLAPERVDIADVTLKSGRNRGHIGGSIVIERFDEIPALDLDMYGTAMLGELGTAFGAPLPLTGELATTAHITSDSGGENFAVTGRSEVRRLSVDGFGLGDAQGAFSSQGRTIRFTDGKWAFSETEMACSGALNLDDNLSFSFRGGGEDMSIYALLDNLQIPGAWADVHISGDVTGTGQLRPEFSVEGEGRGVFTDLQVANRDVRRAKSSDMVLVNTQPIAVQAGFFADIDHLRMDGFIDDTLTHADGAVTLNFAAEEGLLIESEGATGDLASVGGMIGPLPLTGRGGFDLRVFGPYTDPQISANVRGQNVVIDGFAVADKATTQVAYRNAAVDFTDIAAQKGSTRVAGECRLDWLAQLPRYSIRDEAGAPLAVPIQTRTEGLALESHLVVLEGRAEELRAMIPERFGDEGVMGFFRTLDVAGPMSAEVRVNGHIADGTTDHLVGGGDIILGRGLTLLGQPLSKGAATVRLLPDRVDIAGLKASVARGTVQSDVRIRRDDGNTVGKLTATGVALDAIAALQEASDPFAGLADATFDLSGPVNNIIVDGTLALKAVAYGELPIGDASLTVHHEDRRAALSGPVISKRGRGVFSVGTTAPYAYSARIDLNEGPLRPLLPRDTLRDDIQVTLAGRAESTGALSTVAKSRGSIALNVLRLVADKSALYQESAVLAHFSGDKLEVDQLALVTDRDDRIQVTGGVTSNAADLQLFAEGDLWTLRPFISGIDRASGGISARIGMQGDWDSVALTGRASLRNAEMKFSAFDPVARHVDATFRFQNGSVLVERAKGSLDTAPFRVRGDVKMRGLSPERYNLTMNFTDLKLAVPDWLPTRSSGEVTLTGPAALPTLGGEVELLSAVYSEDIDVNELLPEFRRRAQTVNSFNPDDEELRYNLHLVSDGGIAVRNNVADIDARGDLYLVGTDERPGLRGSLVLIDGTARFRQNQFRFTQGTVEFADSTEITPILNVDAETRVRDYDITAHFDGPLRDLRVTFSSRPQLQEIDVLALLTFGFTQLELQDTTVSAGAAGLEVVSAYTGLDEEVRRILPKAVREGGVLTVDELRLTSMFSTRQQSNVPAVRVGFEVNPGWWGLDGSKLRLSSTLLDQSGQGADQRIEWEKRFDSNLRLRLTWNSQDKAACPQCTNQYGDVGGDLWYRWEF